MINLFFQYNFIAISNYRFICNAIFTRWIVMGAVGPPHGKTHKHLSDRGENYRGFRSR